MTLATHKKIANEIVNAKMEELKDTDYNSATLDETDPNLPPSRTTIVVGGLEAKQDEGLGLRVTVKNIDKDPLAPPAYNYKEVRVNLAWKEAGKVDSRVVEMVTNIAPK